jgi:hypothetical protein
VSDLPTTLGGWEDRVASEAGRMVKMVVMNWVGGEDGGPMGTVGVGGLPIKSDKLPAKLDRWGRRVAVNRGGRVASEAERANGHCWSGRVADEVG